MKAMIRALLLLILCVVWLPLSATATDTAQIVSIFIAPPVGDWFIEIQPDGMVKATYGSLPQHQIYLVPGSVDFAKVLSQLKSLVTDQKVAGGTQVAFMRRGEPSNTAAYIRDDQMLRSLIPSDPEAWQLVLPKLTGDMKADGPRIGPISAEMNGILLKHPIYGEPRAKQ